MENMGNKEYVAAKSRVDQLKMKAADLDLDEREELEDLEKRISQYERVKKEWDDLQRMMK